MKKQFKLVLFTCALAALAIGLEYSAVRGHPRIKSVLKACGALLAPRTVLAQGVTVLWKADMETNGNPGPDLGQWYSPSCCASSNHGGDIESSGIASAAPSFDYNHTPGGIFSAMLKTNTPDTTQIPSSGSRLFRWLESETFSDLYYSIWYYFPQLYTPNDPVNPWWNVFEWKSNHCTGGVCTSDPFFILDVGETTYNGQQVMYFYLFNSQTRTSYAQQPPYTFIPVGQWFQLEAHYTCAGDATGRVTIWQNGSSTPLFDVSGVQTRYADGNCEWSVNNYSNSLSPNPATIYVDDAAICQYGRCPWPLP
jgi:hypothetical protein